MNIWLLALTVILAGLFSLTKGWGVFLAIPLFCLLSPLLCFSMIKVARLKKATQLTRADAWLFLAYPLAYLAIFICLVGLSDTSDVVAFGAFIVPSSSPLATLSHQACFLALGIFIVMTFFVYRQMRRIARQLKSDGKQSVLNKKTAS